MRYVFHPEALSECTEAVQYYMEQRVEVAQAFINAVEDAVYRIRESPTRWHAVDENLRRCLTHKFPYGILYTIEQDAIEQDYILNSGSNALQPRFWLLEKAQVAPSLSVT